MTTAPERLAQRLVDERLLPHAAAVDRADVVPREQLDALADAGLYGLSGPVAAGGLGADARTAAAVVEILASGCLPTTFVWLQHQSVVRAVAAGPPELRATWLADLCSGARRAGIAVAGVRPGAAQLRVREREGGFVLDGTSPWVTGWERIDVVHTAALAENGDVVWLLVDALLDTANAPTLRSERQRLVAVDASDTVTLTFHGHVVGADRLTGRMSYDDWQAADAAGLRGNGSLALGVVRRCAALLDDPTWARRLDEARAELDGADTAAMPAARARAAQLAWQAAGALVVATGSRAVVAGSEAERLAREAMFLLVFGTRPAIRAELLELLCP